MVEKNVFASSKISTSVSTSRHESKTQTATGDSTDVPEEKQTLLKKVEDKKEKVKKGFKSFRHYLYHRSDKGENLVCDRNGKSWLLLILFYIALYTITAIISIVLFYFYYLTLDRELPRYYLDHGFDSKLNLIGRSPGLAYQPWDRKHPTDDLITFNTSDKSTYEPYVAAFKSYLAANKFPENRNCTGDESNAELVDEHGRLWKNGTLKKPCRFDVKPYLKAANCTKHNSFGYAIGEPCVILSLNKLINWKPKGNISVSCKRILNSKEKHDKIKSNLSYEYWPSTFDAKYYPYAYMDSKKYNYSRPLIIVKFKNLEYHKDDNTTKVHCSAIDANIEVDDENLIGMVQFELDLLDPHGKKDED